MKILQSRLIKLVKEEIMNEGNNDKVYLDFVESKIKKAIPEETITDTSNAMKRFISVMFKDKDVEQPWTPSYLIPILMNSLNLYYDGFNYKEL